MIPTFVISLPDCVDRRRMISNRMCDLEIPFKFIDAIDGRHGLSSDYEPMIDREKSYPLTDPELACALSHLKAYKRIVDERISYAMILEDDAIPCLGLPLYLAGKFFEQAEITSLFYNKIYVHRAKAKSLFGKYISFCHEPGVRHAGATGYIVSLSAARFILNNSLPVTSVADWPDCVERFRIEQKWHLISPKLVHHDKIQPSTIDPIRITRPTNNPSHTKKRLLGVYIPHRTKVWQSLERRCSGFKRIG